MPSIHVGHIVGTSIDHATAAMTLNVSNFVSVREKARLLGCTIPDNSLILLPDNFERAAVGDELRFESQASTVSKVLRAANLSCARLKSPTASEAFIHNRSHELALPIIFFSAELLKANPDIVTLVIDAFQNYVMDLFKGVRRDAVIKADIIIEGIKKGQTKRIKYEGNAEGLKEVRSLVKRMVR